ncbi:MAG: cyclase family protein [Thaumarchaeota archaeon]|nr:cyclase family protein [Nitrososphaerota archaeon]
MADFPLIKEIVDLSVPMKSQDTPIYPGYPQPLKTNFSTIRDDGYLSNVWSFVEHSATHVDAPAHFAEGGSPVEKMPLGHYVGQGLVLDFTDKPKRYAIGRRDIEEGLQVAGLRAGSGEGYILLIHTGYTEKSRTPDWFEHPDLTKEACEFIVSKKFGGVGFDAPGPDHAPFDAHKALLPNEVVIFENLNNLDRVKDKKFLFVGTPLALVGGSASPCRAVALVL